MAKDLSDFSEGFNPEAYRKEAEELGEQIAEYMNRGYLNSLRKSNVHVTRAFQERYTAIGYQLQFGIISEEEYFDKLAQIRDRFFAKDTQEWYKYTAEIYNHKVNALTEYEAAVEQHLKELAQATLNEYSGTVKNLAKVKDAYKDKLDDFVGTGVGYDTKVTKIHNYYPTGDPLVITDYSLSKLDEEIEKLRAFDETIQALKDRANSLDPNNFAAFFEELRTLSVEDANQLAKLLLAEDDESFSSYLAAYGEKKALEGSIADNLYKEDFEKVAEDIRQDIENAFAEIPEDFFAYGGTTAENFKAGFTAEILSLFSEVEELLGISLDPNFLSSTEHNTYAPTYNLYGGGETVAQQLMTARNFSTLEALRQGATN